MRAHRSALAPLFVLVLALALGCASSGTPSADARSASVSLSSAAEGAESPTTGKPLLRVRQKATLMMHPQIAHPGKKASSAKRAKSAMSAWFSPVRKGRLAILERKTGSKWRTVSRARQSSRGAVEFTAPFKKKGKVQKYRVKAPQAGRLARVTSKPVAADFWGKPDFSDEFSGTAVDLTSWKHQIQGYQPSSKRTCSKVDPSATTQSGGLARIGVLDDPTKINGVDMCRHGFEGDNARYNWRYNGHINSEDSYTFKYGYAAARIKFNKRRGQHGSLFLWPERGHPLEGSAKRTGAEIDVIEWFGKDRKPSPMTSFVYYYPDDGEPGVTGKKIPNSGAGLPNLGRYGKKWHRKFHVFSVEWTPRHYVFRIDGKRTLRVTKGVSGVPQFLNLSNLASDYELKFLGDGEPGDDANTYGKRLPQKMAVDWVRVWELDR